MNDTAPSWRALEAKIGDLDKALSAWEDLVRQQIPGDDRKREFLALMGNFHERISRLQNKYYDLADAAYTILDRGKSKPDAWPIDPAFATTIQIMKSLPDVKKKWFRHKK